jgi:hypothetical protein
MVAFALREFSLPVVEICGANLAYGYDDEMEMILFEV